MVIAMNSFQGFLLFTGFYICGHFLLEAIIIFLNNLFSPGGLVD